LMMRAGVLLIENLFFNCYRIQAGEFSLLKLAHFCLTVTPFHNRYLRIFDIKKERDG